VQGFNVQFTMDKISLVYDMNLTKRQKVQNKRKQKTHQKMR